MSGKKLGQDSAFPLTDAEFREIQWGMSKRLLIAKDAMCAMISNPNIKRPHPEDGSVEDQLADFVKIAYEYADELLKQEGV